jgi:hypothetical protein
LDPHRRHRIMKTKQIRKRYQEISKYWRPEIWEGEAASRKWQRTTANEESQPFELDGPRLQIASSFPAVLDNLSYSKSQPFLSISALPNIVAFLNVGGFFNVLAFVRSLDILNAQPLATYLSRFLQCFMFCDHPDSFMFHSSQHNHY